MRKAGAAAPPPNKAAQRKGRTTMPLYLIRFGYTPEEWAKTIKQPEDRRATIGPMLEAPAASCTACGTPSATTTATPSPRHPTTPQPPAPCSPHRQRQVPLTVHHGAADRRGNPE